MTFLHFVAQLDFFLSSNNDVTRTLAHDSGYYSPLRVKKLGKIPHGLRPLEISPRFFTLRGAIISLIIRQSPRNVPLSSRVRSTKHAPHGGCSIAATERERENEPERERYFSCPVPIHSYNETRCQNFLAEITWLI